jgi:hypothetical protein
MYILEILTVLVFISLVFIACVLMKNNKTSHEHLQKTDEHLKKSEKCNENISDIIKIQISHGDRISVIECKLGITRDEVVYYDE